MKSKKGLTCIVFGSICCIGLCVTLLMKNVSSSKADVTTMIPQTESELFPTKEISSEYAKDNLYVQMNNKLVKAMNDYEAGKISEAEYCAICDEISKVTNDKDNQKRMKKEEEAYRKAVGE